MVKRQWVSIIIGIGSVLLSSQAALSIQNELLDAWEPLDPMEMAISVDDLPTHGKVPAGMNSRDIGKSVLAAFQDAHTPPIYGFSNGIQLTWDPNSLEVLKDWLGSGHFLGNHTFSHMDLAQSTAEAFIADIVAMDGLLASLSPTAPSLKVFRYPYMSDGNMGKGDRVRNFLKKNGYQIAPVTVDYKDWAWNSAYLKCHVSNDEAQVQWLRQHVVAAARREVRQAQTAAKLVAGRDIRHILLLHLSAFNALTLADVLAALQADGVKFINLRRAMDDPIYGLNPSGTTFIEQYIKAKNLLAYPYGIQMYPPERLEAMCNVTSTSALQDSNR